MKVRPLISWPGGKTRHLNRILPYVPTNSDSGYIEAFAGGCALLLAKSKSRLEVVNDINNDLVNLYRVAANHAEELARIVATLPPASRTQIAHSRQLLATKGCLTDIYRAAIFLHLNKTSFSGNGSSLAVVVNPSSKAFIGTASLIDRIHAFQSRFDSVVIENVSYERLLETYDHPKNFIFLDPPYGVSNVRNYDGWNENDLTAFRNRVASLSGKWIVTLDDSALNRQLWVGHDVDFSNTRNMSGNLGQSPDRYFGEMFIYSPGLRPRSEVAILKVAA